MKTRENLMIPGTGCGGNVPATAKKQRPEHIRASENYLDSLPVEGRCRIVLSHNLLRVFRQGLRLRQKLETFHHLRIGLGTDFHAFILSESVLQKSPP